MTLDLLFQDGPVGTDVSAHTAPDADNLVDSGCLRRLVPDQPRALEDPSAQPRAAAALSEALLLVHVYLECGFLFSRPDQRAFSSGDQHSDPAAVLHQIEQLQASRTSVEQLDACRERPLPKLLQHAAANAVVAPQRIPQTEHQRGGSHFSP